jgi:hypothetical protein
VAGDHEDDRYGSPKSVWHDACVQWPSSAVGLTGAIDAHHFCDSFHANEVLALPLALYHRNKRLAVFAVFAGLQNLGLLFAGRIFHLFRWALTLLLLPVQHVHIGWNFLRRRSALATLQPR